MGYIQKLECKKISRSGALVGIDGTKDEGNIVLHPCKKKPLCGLASLCKNSPQISLFRPKSSCRYRPLCQDHGHHHYRHGQGQGVRGNAGAAGNLHRRERARQSEHPWWCGDDLCRCPRGIWRLRQSAGGIERHHDVRKQDQFPECRARGQHRLWRGHPVQDRPATIGLADKDHA